jgi:Ycf66 protein N-terminus
MLTYVLALVVIIASVGLYSTTFVLPEVSRKNDLAWSGLGLFYGLVLWVCAERITGGVLLGQMASVGLMGWLGWQMVESRWNETPELQRVNADKVKGLRDTLTNLAQSETAIKLKTQAQGVISKAQGAVQDLGVPVETGDENLTTTAAPNVVKPAEPPLTPEDFGNPPKVEIDMTAAKPAMRSFSKPAIENPLGGLFDRAKGLATGLNAPKKNKEVYVRKSKDEGVAETTSAVKSSIDDDFDFGDEVETTADKPMTTSMADTVAEAMAHGRSETIEEWVTEESEVETADLSEVAEGAVAKAVEVVDEFGDAIVEAVEKRMEDS